MPHYTQLSRVTLMPVMSAADGIAPLFVFKGKRLPYRKVLVYGSVELQTLTLMLSRSACLSVREEHGWMKSRTF